MRVERLHQSAAQTKIKALGLSLAPGPSVPPSTKSKRGRLELMHHEHRHARMIEYVARNAAKYPLDHFAEPIGPHHERVGGDGVGFGQEPIRNVLSRRGAGMTNLRANAVFQQQALCFRYILRALGLIDCDNGHVFGSAQPGQGVFNGSARLRPRFPRDQDMRAKF